MFTVHDNVSAFVPVQAVVHAPFLVPFPLIRPPVLLNWYQQHAADLKTQNMAGRLLCEQEGHSIFLQVVLSLQLTVHVHQGLTAFGQNLQLLPLCVPIASYTLFRHLWSALESLLPPLPLTGPRPFRPKAFLLLCLFPCPHPASWPP